ncbi:MAG: queuosine precursor transporter [Gammaproteobacteria bacterium]|nr:queuosine precursor transporter [Gammaproteobacteria bacterium]
MTVLEPKYRLRRQRVFLLLSGIFLGTLGMLNILGITRFIDLSFEVFGLQIPMTLAVGVLPYPITFFCTDLISEIYGRKRATDMVWVGLVVNVWVMIFIWLGGALPGYESIDPNTGELALDAAGRPPLFFEVQTLALGSVTASMIAYLSAQYCDVRLFHFWKWLTKGKYLWIRNNGSTLISQLVDTTAVILIAHFLANALPIDANQSIANQLVVFIASGYVFKLVVALVDTGPIYAAVHFLRPYLNLQPNEEVDPTDFSSVHLVVEQSTDTQEAT